MPVPFLPTPFLSPEPTPAPQVTPTPPPVPPKQSPEVLPQSSPHTDPLSGEQLALEGEGEQLAEEGMQEVGGNVDEEVEEQKAPTRKRTFLRAFAIKLKKLRLRRKRSENKKEVSTLIVNGQCV